MKFVLWLIIGVVAVSWLFRKKKSLPGRPAQRRASDETAESMVECAHCGIHIPASEAVLDASSTPFCCDAHRLQYHPRHQSH
ncbi:MAG: PP0621 family protein [Herbaspirillum sp.]